MVSDLHDVPDKKGADTIVIYISAATHPIKLHEMLVKIFM